MPKPILLDILILFSLKCSFREIDAQNPERMPNHH